MKKLIYGFILLFCIALNGCKKDDLIFKKEQLLGQWTFIKELKKVNNDAEVEIPITSQTYDFKSTGDVDLIEGGQILLKAKWELINGRYLRINNQDPNYTITKLDEHNLIYYYIYTDASGTTQYTFYYTR